MIPAREGCTILHILCMLYVVVIVKVDPGLLDNDLLSFYNRAWKLNYDLVEIINIYA